MRHQKLAREKSCVGSAQDMVRLYWHKHNHLFLLPSGLGRAYDQAHFLVWKIECPLTTRFFAAMLVMWQAHKTAAAVPHRLKGF